MTILFNTSKDLMVFFRFKLIFTRPNMFGYSKSFFICHLSSEKLLQATEETPEKYGTELHLLFRER